MKNLYLLPISALLAISTVAPGVAAAENPHEEAGGAQPVAVSVTARELFTKVFGVASHSLTSDELKREAIRVLNMVPAEDEGGLWLDSSDGYCVSYYGMTPRVSAVAMFDNPEGPVSNFCYFFLFPYAGATRERANFEQCAFCSSLLQEMDDIGMDMGCPESTDALFEASGNYGENLVNIRLIDQNTEAGTEGSAATVADKAGRGDAAGGSYVVVVYVEPRAFTEADNWMAEARP